MTGSQGIQILFGIFGFPVWKLWQRSSIKHFNADTLLSCGSWGWSRRHDLKNVFTSPVCVLIYTQASFMYQEMCPDLFKMSARNQLENGV